MKRLSNYRKSILLIFLFIGLITVSLIITLFFSFQFTQKLVETKFNNDKSIVSDSTIAPYNHFIFNEIPQISLYKGFLDSASFSGLTANYLGRYSFIDEIVFYDVEISNHEIQDGFTADKFAVGVKAVYRLQRQENPKLVSLFKRDFKGEFSVMDANEFARSMFKFVDFVGGITPDFTLSNDVIFNNFYTFFDDYVSYLNVPREADLLIYKDLMQKVLPRSPIYDQDLVTFGIAQMKLDIQNPRPNLYEKVLIRPAIFDSLTTDKKHFVTSAPLPGVFSEYQLYFISSKRFLNKWVMTLFAPVALVIVVVYAILLLIGLLIYRNININRKLFKLQYDFINNLSHEFKTPVSVIKIAGSNMQGERQMEHSEVQHYGKILDEEADKLNDLMNKLLSITQVENNTIVLRSDEVDIELFCKKAVNEYKIKHPDFDISFDIQDIVTLETDEVILGSIFQNLINNAYKYSAPDRKNLEIKIFRHDKRNEVVFQFIDQGIGIPEKEYESIFNKFYKVDNEFNQTGSAGIGLAFCREMIQVMRGRIFVHSKVGEGSIFTVMLPEK